MRWILFLLLLTGAWFCISGFFPESAGQAGLIRPFVQTETQTAYSPLFPILVLFSGGLGFIFFFLSLVFLFMERSSLNTWNRFTLGAAVFSMIPAIQYFSPWATIPLVISLILLTGTVTRRWIRAVERMRVIQLVPEKVHPLMHIPVPWVFVLAYLAGIGLQLLSPLPGYTASSLRTAGLIAGLILLGSGAWVAVWCLLIFRKLRTTTVPLENSAGLATYGPYRYSRNPMYVSLLVMYTGEALVLGQLWPFLLLPFVIAYLQWILIPHEEDRLTKIFGEVYLRYCMGVNRWI